MRFFNTTGPVEPADHYCVPPLERLDLDAVLTLVRNKRYFVMHAPRQTGKTSTLLALRDLLNGGGAGDYRCVYANVEAGQAGREDTQRAMRAILGHLALVARVTLRDEFVDRIWSDALDRFGPDGALTEVLSRWTEADPRPLVVFIDEIDTLVGDTLLSVLRQLRAGYTLRPDAFPQSVILCGVRDVRDALGDDACFRNKAGRDHRQSITADAVTEARERLIVRRETHLDQLADKLQEDRVRRVIEPLLSGGDEREFSARDLEYVRDLGLIARDDPPRIANPVYAEVVPRELTCAAQAGLVEETSWYIDADGGLNMVKLLTAFQAFFREHSEHWVERFAYKEAGPQLLLQAYLQRVVNGGGRIEREYGLGRGRTDLLIVRPQGSRTHRFVVECKVRRKSLERTVRDGVAQTAGYLDRCGAESGHLVIFDRGDGAWANKIFHRQESAGEVRIDVWGM